MAGSGAGRILTDTDGRAMVRVVMQVMAAERKRRRVTQTEVARRMGVAPAAVSRWESGSRDLQLGTFLRYAGAFTDITAIRRAMLRLRDGGLP